MTSARYGTGIASGGRRAAGGRLRTVLGMDALVQLSDVTKRYDHDGAAAVARVSLEVASGEAHAGFGAKGCGP